jgi:hypothetical protein
VTSADLPALNAGLNALSGAFLLTGATFIRLRREHAHRVCMLAAFVTSAFFLVSYLVYHALHGSTPFTGQGPIRTLYFTILISHTILAAEVRIGLNEHDRRGVWAMGSAGASNLVSHGFGGDANGPNPSNDSSDDIIGCKDVMAELGAETLRQERMTCCESCPSTQAAPRSLHPPGGVHVVMCDGSARWVGDDINTAGANATECCSVWDRLIASQDGLPVEFDN